MTSKPNNPLGLFQPVYDIEIEKYGYKTALVLSRVRRRCDCPSGLCWESIPNIAKGLQMNEKTVRGILVALEESGEIVREDREGKAYQIRMAEPMQLNPPYPSTGTENGTTTPTENGTSTGTENGTSVLRDKVRDNIRDNESVVNPENAELESLRLLGAKNPRVKNPTGWAIEMHRKGITAAQVVAERSNKKKSRKRPDPDSEQSRQRYVEGIPEGD